MPFIFLDHNTSSFSKDISAEDRILRWSFFFFFLQQLNNIVPLFMASVASDEKYVV